MTSSHRTYHPRDVINAPEIKARIAERSAERGDSAEIAAWMGNHFYRHVIGNFNADPPAVQPLHHWSELEVKYPFSAPDWAHKALGRLKRQTAAAVPSAPNQARPVLGWWIEPDSAPLLALEARLVEFLNSRQGTALEGKLQRINCPQALARWTLEHLEFAQKRERGLLEHQPGAVKPILQGEHGIFVEFDPKSPHLRLEMAYESQMMRHCLGQFADRQALTGGYGEQYASACEAGRMRLFSYRSRQAHPHITISAYVEEDGRLRIDQIKGKQNRPPVERYHIDVLALLNHLPTTEDGASDALTMQLFRRPDFLCGQELSPWCRASELTTQPEQLWLLRAHPECLDTQHLQTPLMQWLVAARHEQMPDALFTHMPRTPALQRTIELARNHA